MYRRPAIRAVAWLAFLAPFFFLTYNFANLMASRRVDVHAIMFSWERNIPFLAWTILPYWSLDLLYGLSLFMCCTRAELDLHGKRLLAVQVFSTACFLAFPLRCAFERPPLSGWTAGLFEALLSFDKPFNQAPSLHASIAVILWRRYRAHTRGLIRGVIGSWLVLAALSTLTTWQHHFIDVPAGVWAGLLILAALPERRAAEVQTRLTLLYLAGSIICAAIAFAVRGPAWLLLWPAFSLSMVSAAYWTGDPVWLAKRNGRVAFWMWPYTAAAWINSRLWTRAEPARNHLVDQVWIGRAPSRLDRDGIRSVIDLTAELGVRGDICVPMLDLIPPTDDQLNRAVTAISKLTAERPTLVCCALGYSRTAIASAAWLMVSGHATGAGEALAQVRRARPQVIVGPKLELRLRQWAERRNGNHPDAPYAPA
jgi:membrane-associated phospholipid phosphatase